MKSKKHLNPVYEKKSTRVVYLLLKILVIMVMVRHAIQHDYESVFLCALSLLLFVLPSIVERELWVRLPATLEIIILLFIFAAEILGEVNQFYLRVPHWDTVLHTLNGFLCAAIGFAQIDLFNRSHRFKFEVSALFLAVVAFCFSMTVGVIWEFFEFGCDNLFYQDMQKDTVVTQFKSAYPIDGDNQAIGDIKDIVGVIVVHSDGSQERLAVDGYLDIGLHDTMKDLIVNAVGAMTFSVIGFFYLKKRGHNRFAECFIPEVLTTKS